MPDKPWHFANVVCHQRDIGRFNCGVGSHGSHSDAVMRARHRRSVIHTIPDHRDSAILCHQFLNGGDLVLGQEFGAHLVDPHISGNRPCRCRVVAGKHHDLLDPLRMQTCNDPLGIGPDPVAQLQHTAHPIGIADRNQCAPRPFDPIAQVCRDIPAKALFLGKPVRTQPDQLAIKLALKTPTGHCSGLIGGSDLHPVLLRPGKNGARKRVR